MAYTSTTGWKYGYINDAGRFVPINDPKSNIISESGKRPVFFNENTRQILYYTEKENGAPGNTAHQRGVGVGAILYYLDTGGRPESGKGKDFLDYFIAYQKAQGIDVVAGESDPIALEEIKTDHNNNPINKDDTDTDTDTDTEQDAFNQYYNDLYSLNKGTSGAKMYDRLTESYQNQAAVASTLAEAQYQQQAMQQAQVVKQITDQVRAERMARLKAGMSEAQIANQDMQMMMTNVNALNQNNAMLNQARLEATGAMMTAQDQAYADYLNQANARGQVAMAGYATDAGNVAYQVTQYLANNPGTTYAQAYKVVTGQLNK